MAMTDKKKLELLFLRVEALEKALEAITGAYSGLMVDHVEANTADSEIITEADKIKPKKVRK